MYFASLNINLATYFSLTCSCLLKHLLSSIPDSPTPSRPPNSRHLARERRNPQVEANASHDFGPNISVQIPSLTGILYSSYLFAIIRKSSRLILRRLNISVFFIPLFDVKLRSTLLTVVEPEFVSHHTIRGLRWSKSQDHPWCCNMVSSSRHVS